MLSGANRYWGHNPGQGQVVFSYRKAPDKIYWLRSGCRSPQEMAPKVKSIALCRWWLTDRAVFAAVDTGERKPGLLNPCKAPVTARETLLGNLLPRHWQDRGWTFVPVYWLSHWSDCLILLLQLMPSRELQSSLQSYYTLCLPPWVCPQLTSPKPSGSQFDCIAFTTLWVRSQQTEKVWVVNSSPLVCHLVSAPSTQIGYHSRNEAADNMKVNRYGCLNKTLSIKTSTWGRFGP